MTKISVVIATYREKRNYLRQAIISCLASEGVEVDLIITTVKGDPGIKVARSFGIKKIVVNKKPDIFKQLNAAIPLVEGEWFCIFSGNDIMMPGKLVTELAVAEKSKKKVCYSAFHITDEKLKHKHTRYWYDYDYNKHLVGNFVHDGALMHRSIFDKYMPYQLRWGNHACWDFWLRVYEGEGNVFAYNPIPIFKYRKSEDSQHTMRKKDKEKREKNNLDRDIMLAYHRNLKNKTLLYRKLNIYCQLASVKKLVLRGGDMVNEINLFMAMEKFANVYYSGSRFDSQAPDFGTVNYPESIETRMNERVYDLYYVRSNKTVFEAIPRGKPKIWFSIPYDRYCYDSATAIASLTPPFTDAIKAGNYLPWVPSQYRGQGYNKAITLHQTIEDKFKPLQNHPRTKQIRKSLQNKFIIGELGKVGASSYPHAFLSILPRLIKKHNIQYLVASGAKQRNLIVTDFATRRSFTHSDMPYVTSACDLIIISTWTIGWHYGGCRRLLQATTCGVPVILGRSLSREEFLGIDYPLFVPPFNDGISSVKKVTEESIKIDGRNLMKIFNKIIPDEARRLEIGRDLRRRSEPYITDNYPQTLEKILNDVISDNNRNQTAIN